MNASLNKSRNHSKISGGAAINAAPPFSLCLQKFYKDSFACIGCRLLYIDDNSSKEKYYEHPEDVQKFLSRLKELCTQAEMEVTEDVYGEFLKVLEQYGPDYYSEEALEVFKKIIKN